MRYPVFPPVVVETRYVRVVNGVASLPDGRTIQSEANYIAYPVVRNLYPDKWRLPKPLRRYLFR